ncbi:hypothetical protein ZIOFF_011540 [Zingiber officinale]|uniref:Retropepsins domain-containing protein n=1 Tax=Zingiber officinale TaxID=94328 RepID=A0A8J5HR58_ZINOF|nr:hypothetical protein ZIOFF_011540 [Zingiber officinale]
MDDRLVTEDTLQANFLIPRDSDAYGGRSLSEVCCESLRDFNPMVRVSAEKDYLASTGIHAVSATPRTIAELQGMKWILQPPSSSHIRNPQEEFKTKERKNLQGYFFETNPSNRWEALGEPDTNPRWDTLGEPSGRYNFYVNYAAPPPAPFIPPTRPMWDDDDNDDRSTDAAKTKVITEVVLPSIWEDTPWEEDPYLDIYGFDDEENYTPFEHESHITEGDYEDEDLSVHFLGLENLDNDYPISPNTVLPNEQQQVSWDDSDSELENYWQNIVEQVEHMEDQYFVTQATRRMGELSIQETSSTENEGDSHTEQQDVTNEIAHAGIEAPLIEQLEGLEYPILRSMMNQAVNENAFSSTSAISRSIAQLVFEKIMIPPVMEVNDLRQTVRGTGSFGSTEMEELRSSDELIFSAARKSLINRLYNIEIILQIPGINDTKVQAILDTGATTCCICQNALPNEAFEDINYKVLFSGINSQQEASKKLRNGYMTIGVHKFRIPFTYQLEMNLKDGIQMLVGCNFIKSMAGGLRIEGSEITFYKEITTIRTSPEVFVSAKAIPELDMNEEEYLTMHEDFFIPQHSLTTINFKMRYATTMQKLKEAGYIGENPTLHWSKNKVLCTLDIINPDITIQDKPLKHVTPAMEATFKVPIEALLKLKVIQPSMSRHRTIAFIVQSGTTVDPATGQEKKG